MATSRVQPVTHSKRMIGLQRDAYVNREEIPVTGRKPSCGTATAHVPCATGRGAAHTASDHRIHDGYRLRDDIIWRLSAPHRSTAIGSTSGICWPVTPGNNIPALVWNRKSGLLNASPSGHTPRIRTTPSALLGRLPGPYDLGYAPCLSHAPTRCERRLAVEYLADGAHAMTL
jgi:hypothetical protein